MSSACASRRIIALIDLDCFYCQVEESLNPELKGKPVAVVQYNKWKGGGIIAVNYEARNKGVTRGMRGAEAKKKCPQINLVSVPVLRGKADLSKYRAAGEKVVEVFTGFSDQIQKASIDEAYIDLTKAVQGRINEGVKDVDPNQLKSTYIVGFSHLKNNNEEQRASGVKEWINLMKESTTDSPEFRLTIGAIIVEEIRSEILLKTGFHCSAGIAQNKILAKLVAGLHKPKHQTILPQDNVPELYDSLPLYKIRNLGGKFGSEVSKKLSIQYMSELYNYRLEELQQKFNNKHGLWLYNIARGIDFEPVTPRLIPDSVGCSKNFPGVEMLRSKQMVRHWITELADEICERLVKDLEKNKRRAKQIIVTFSQTTPVSRKDTLNAYDTGTIAETAFALLTRFNNAPSSSTAWDPPIKYLGLSASKFSKENPDSFNSFFKCKPTVSALQNLDRGPGKPGTSDTKDDPSDGISLGAGSSRDESTGKTVCTNGNGTEKSFFLSFLNNRSLRPVKGTIDDETPVEGCSSLRDDAEDEERIEETVEEEEEKEEEEICIKGKNEGMVKDEPRTSFDRSNLSNETTACEVCHENINVLDYFEHLDYHTALELQTQINGETKVNLNVNTLEGENKRKRVDNPKGRLKKFRDIKSFFPVITK